MSELIPFHLAFPVDDLEAAEHFYCEVLGCTTGRRAAEWIDFNFFGHQIVAHRVAQLAPRATNPVDAHEVPVPHFGAILEWTQWQVMAEQLRQRGMAFVIEPYIRFAGQKGEQATMFFLDPAGNAIELKAFRRAEQIFEH